jgi:hypothetical protein
MNQKAYYLAQHAAFGVVTRDDAGESRAQSVVDRYDPLAPVLTQKGVSCVATARCLLGATMAECMPPQTECVVLLDDDVEPSPGALNMLITSAISSARTGHPTVYVASYPLRLPTQLPDQPKQVDNRIAHRIAVDGNVSGGLGCIAIPAALFRWLHLGDWSPLYSVMDSAPPSTCPYRVGPLHGTWTTEDLYFFSVLRELTIPSRLLPTVVRHGGRSAAADWKDLNGRPLPSCLTFE